MSKTPVKVKEEESVPAVEIEHSPEMKAKIARGKVKAKKTK